MEIWIHNEKDVTLWFFHGSVAQRVWEDFKERFDKSNLTRVYQLWAEVESLKQGTDSVTDYYSTMRDLWDELDMRISSPCYECVEAKSYISHLHQKRLLMFLMALNEAFTHVRSDILMKTETPIVNQAYSTVVQEESQHVLGVVESNKEPLTLLAGRGQHHKGKKPLLATTCEICGFKNHLTADCYRLVGYPPDFKSKIKPAQSGSYQIGTPGPYQTGMGNSRSTQQGSYQSCMGSSNELQT
ncbi:uncharacterized protein [Solanum lycopersicum]|uniref:uncharacterized protein n=1 Tax=Solanum lycopersicum TaxID=4081 RepID=UPI000532D721|nr:uncharacterized protein LOC104644330 [Solanum lycopersicum]